MTCEEALCMRAKSLQSCPTFCDPMNFSLPGSSVHGDSPGKNTGVGCHALLQGIFQTQGSNPCLLWLLHCKWILYHWATWESPCGALLNPKFHDFYLFILAALGLSCGMWDVFSCSMWDLVPWPGIKPRPPEFGAWGLSHCTTKELPQSPWF